jgi:hypothetical protein
MTEGRDLFIVTPLVLVDRVLLNPSALTYVRQN